MSEQLLQTVEATSGGDGAMAAPMDDEAIAELRNRAAEDLLFYNRGKGDYVRGMKTTPAAIGFVAYWSNQDKQP